MLTPAIRFVTKGVKDRSVGTIQLLCRVKPGVSVNREGITTISDQGIEVCVAAQARDGEANKAVREVIAGALQIPKSDVEVVKGMKSHKKTVAVANTSMRREPEEDVARVKELLIKSFIR